MKKVIPLFFVLAVICSVPSFSQIQRGNVLVGGNVANFNLGLQSGTPFTMSLEPKAAFFVRDNVAVGGYVSFGLQTVPGSTGSITSYGVGALARYYLGAQDAPEFIKHSRIFFEGNAGISGRNVPHGSSTNGLGLGIGPGIAYFITPNIGLETILKYNGLVGFGNATTQSDLNLNVGFQIYLPTKRLRTTIERDTR